MITKRSKSNIKRKNPNNLDKLRSELLSKVNYYSQLSVNDPETKHFKLLKQELENVKLDNQLYLDELMITLGIRENLYKELYKIGSKYRK